MRFRDDIDSDLSDSDSELTTYNAYTWRNNTSLQPNRPAKEKNTRNIVKNNINCNYSSKNILHDSKNAGFSNGVLHRRNVYDAREGSSKSVCSVPNFYNPVFSNTTRYKTAADQMSGKSFGSLRRDSQADYSSVLSRQRNLQMTRDGSSMSVCLGPNDYNQNFSTLMRHKSTNDRMKGASPVSFRSEIRANNAREFSRQKNSHITRKDSSSMSVCSVPHYYNPSFSTRIRHKTMSDRMKGVSPTSLRSESRTGSNLDMSAQQVLLALKNNCYSMHEVFNIKNIAEKILNKGRVSKRRLKRKRLRPHSKYTHGGESGDLASNSSDTFDDCRSVKSSTRYDKTLRNMDLFGTSYRPNDDSRSLRSVQLNYSNTKQRQNRIISLQGRPLNNSLFSKFSNENLPRQNYATLASAISNKSVPIHPITEEQLDESNSSDNQMQTFNRTSINKPANCDNVSNFEENRDGQENIFNRTSSSVRHKNNRFEITRKSSPVVTLNQLKNKTRTMATTTATKETSNFVFLKPKTPTTSLPKQRNNHISPENTQDISENTQQCMTDMSLQPSFIRRKLFTQTLELTENKHNDSSDSLSQSPVSNIYRSNDRENKIRRVSVRKSVVRGNIFDDNNQSDLLDLVQKIVPPNYMNTNTVKQQNIETESKALESHNYEENANTDKWDVLSVLSIHNKDNISETFSDEDRENLFISLHDKVEKHFENKVDNYKYKNNLTKPLNISNNLKRDNIMNKTGKAAKPTKTSGENQSKMGVDISTRVKSFWAIDSDIENEMKNSLVKHSTKDEIQLKAKNTLNVVSKISTNKNKASLKTGIGLNFNDSETKKIDEGMKSFNKKNQSIKTKGKTELTSLLEVSAEHLSDLNTRRNRSRRLSAIKANEILCSAKKPTKKRTIALNTPPTQYALRNRIRRADPKWIWDKGED